MNDTVDNLLQARGYPPVRHRTAVGGGDINQASRLQLADGQVLFMKTHAQPPAQFFEAEAAGLEALRASATVRIPRVVAVTPNRLVLEWLDGSPGTDYWHRFGEQLARLHSQTAAQFGFSMDNFCGLTPQPNPTMADGFAFFAEARLEHQGRLARDGKLLDATDARQLEMVAAHLHNWVPEQSPSLMHGDLWSGNAHCGPAGEPVLVDPAAHYGWAEAELAMTTLFGGFPAGFYEAYKTHGNVEPDWASRADLYNLYHLLNHLNLFGGGYYASVKAILKRYAYRHQ